MFTASRLQVTTYLFGVCLFSISFLVFLNSSISFVITDLIHLKHGEGTAVGNLGFADELLALVACPTWGLLSDRVGVRTVATAGFAIVGIALFLFVQAKDVYPQLLLARLFFSFGGAATATMVTAILPSMTAQPYNPLSIYKDQAQNGTGHVVTPSVSSELTITPSRFQSQSSSSLAEKASPSAKSSSRLAGFVGMLTGCGALVALGIFLPLPARFQQAGQTPEQALRSSYYIAGSVAILISIFCFIGFRNLHGEEDKGPRYMFRGLRQNAQSPGDSSTEDNTRQYLPYHRQFLSSFLLGFREINIGLGYVGGFVARASSVGISLFIPLVVNAYFKSSGLCSGDLRGGLGDAKRRCPKAYILAAELTGISQFVALVCAPIFGFVSARYSRHQIPLIIASLCGILGCALFAALPSPRPSGPDGSPAVFIAMALLGISQIGSIVCSLGLLSNGVLGHSESPSRASCISSSRQIQVNGNPETNEDPIQPDLDRDASTEETALLLRQPSESRSQPQIYAHLKGSIAGMYSLYGGAGILLLTKLGGFLFDELSPGAPFYMLAIFNGILLVTAVVCDVWKTIWLRKK